MEINIINDKINLVNLELVEKEMRLGDLINEVIFWTEEKPTGEYEKMLGALFYLSEDIDKAIERAKELYSNLEFRLDRVFTNEFLESLNQTVEDLNLLYRKRLDILDGVLKSGIDQGEIPKPLARYLRNTIINTKFGWGPLL